MNFLKRIFCGHSGCKCGKGNQEQFKKMEALIMATKQEVLDAIAAEKEEVAENFKKAMDLIEELKKQIEEGQAATPADLDEIKSAVSNIFIPAES